MGAVLKDQSIFLNVPRSLFLGMKNNADKRYRENQNTYFFML